MAKALVIGAGGVSSVVCHKCAQNSEVFDSIMIASRTKSKCDAIKDTTKREAYVLTYEESMKLINQMKDEFSSTLFGNGKDDSFKGSL